MSLRVARVTVTHNAKEPAMPDDHAPSPYLTLAEAAAFLRLAPRTLDNMRQRGTGPLYGKHGGRVRYHHDDLVAWADSTRRRTTTEKNPTSTHDDRSYSCQSAQSQGPAGRSLVARNPVDPGS